MTYLPIVQLILVLWHWHHNSAMQNCGPSNWTEINVCEVVEVKVVPFRSKASYCRKGASQKRKSELCSNVGHDRCVWLPAFFSQSFVDIIAFRCRPSLHLLWRQGDWTKTSQGQSLFGCT